MQQKEEYNINTYLGQIYVRFYFTELVFRTSNAETKIKKHFQFLFQNIDTK